MSWRRFVKIAFGTSSGVIFGATAINIDKISQKWDDDWDKRKTESLVPPKAFEKVAINEDEYTENVKSLESKATRHILLIRHGHYDMKSKLDEERKLTDKGREQARQTGRRLRQLNFPYQKIVSSTMQRALETTDFILESLPNVHHTHDDILIEGAPYPPEPPSVNWRPKAKYLEEGARIEAAFRRYIHRANPDQLETSYEIIVCHGNVIRYFVCRALQFPPEGWLRFSVGNGSITWLTIRPNGNVSVRCLGDTGHLDPKLITR